MLLWTCISTPAAQRPNPSSAPQMGAGYEACIPRIVAVLQRMKQRDVTQVRACRGLPATGKQRVKSRECYQYLQPCNNATDQQCNATPLPRATGLHILRPGLALAASQVPACAPGTLEGTVG